MSVPYDVFSGSEPDLAKWTIFTLNGSASVASGKITFATTSADSAYAFGRSNPFNLTGDNCGVQVVTPDSGFGAEGGFVVRDAAAPLRRIQLTMLGTAGDVTYVKTCDAAGADLASTNFSHDLETHPWIRVVEDEGDFVVQVSTDGESWTTGATLAVPAGFDLENAVMDIGPQNKEYTVRSWSFDNAFAPATTTPALLIDTQPSATQSGFLIDPAPVVKMTTDGSTVDTSFNGDVTVELVDSAGVLLGTLTETAVLGVATFADLRPCEDGGKLRFSASGVADLDSASFAVTFGSGGSTLILDDSDMIRPMKDGETVAARKRIPLRLRGLTGGPTTEGMTGRKAQLSVNGGSETPSTADIVHIADTIRGYVQLTDLEANSFAPGDRVEARVEPDTDLVESLGGLDIIEGDWAAAPPSKEEIAKATRDEEIKVFEDGISLPVGSGPMQIKRANGDVVTIAITRGNTTGGIVGAT